MRIARFGSDRKARAITSSFYTLHPGDVLLSGTPQGVGPVKPGDVMEASIAGIGTMRVQVSEE